MSGRKVELDEVIVPSPELESSSSQKSVPVAPTPIEVEAYDSDHETSDQVTTKPRRSTRMCTISDWYVILSWRSCCYTTMNLRAMEKQWWARIPTNGSRP